MSTGNSGIVPLTSEQEAIAEQQESKEGYVNHVLIGLDQFANTVTGGEPDETISSRVGRDATQGKFFGKVMTKFLDLFQRNHSAKAIAGDLERAKTIEDIEQSSGMLPKGIK